MKKGNITSWLIRFAKGTFIGSGFILPGISGGVLAAVFGVYERMINFLANIRNDFKANFFFFLPIAIGGVFGIFLFSALLSYFLEIAEVQLMWFFIGCIIGTLPALWKQSGKHGRGEKHIMVLAFSFAVALIFFASIDNATADILPQNIYTWAFAGGLIGLVAIVPGLSAANILIFFGLYAPMTQGIAAFDMTVIIPLAIGAVVAILVFSRLMAFVLKKAYTGLFHAIIGFVLASTLVIIPLEFDYISIGGIVCLGAAALGVVISRLLCRPDKSIEG